MDLGSERHLTLSCFIEDLSGDFQINAYGDAKHPDFDCHVEDERGQLRLRTADKISVECYTIEDHASVLQDTILLELW